MSLKSKVRFSTTLDKELNEKLKEWSERTGIPQSRIIQFALQDYLDKVLTKSCKNK